MEIIRRMYNKLNYILVDKRYTTHISDIRMKRRINDHFLVVAKIRGQGKQNLILKYGTAKS